MDFIGVDEGRHDNPIATRVRTPMMPAQGKRQSPSNAMLKWGHAPVNHTPVGPRASPPGTFWSPEFHRLLHVLDQQQQAYNTIITTNNCNKLNIGNNNKITIRNTNNNNQKQSHQQYTCKLTTVSISTFGNSIDSSYLLSVSYPVAACSRSSQEFYFRLRIISALSKTKPTTEMADLQTLADKSDGMERKLDAILARLDKLDVMEADMKNLQSNFETDRKHVESKIHVQNSKIVSIEVRLRRKNLIWHGIERSEESDESDLSLIINIVNNIMKVPCSEAEFVDVYRIGKPEEGKVRPICTEFKHLDYKWKVLNQKKALFGSNIFVNLDLPIELRGPRTKRSRPDESNENPGPEDSRKRPPSSPAAQNQSKKNHTAFDRNVRPQQLRNNPTSQKNQGGSKSDNFFRPAK
ncbi:unnamed protein product [Nesidiocoris tenuis]|uniref:Uncharacterized protein n=1 Tax=Nesidiocoris tenuis TaxID=355587 RepID=A0A6H5GDH1_9HEMI|nr:unnamed protein product [Nesidiocoris tenuis]